MTFKLLALATALAIFLVLPVGTQAAETCRSANGGYCLNLAAVVPGLEFLGGTPGDVSGLIARLYVFGLSLVGISALIMFVFGGVIYLTAGDSQNRTNKAKSFMGNAVFGLVLALLSFLILFTINPDLVTRGFPVPTEIKPSRPDAPRRIYATGGETEYWICPVTSAIFYADQGACNLRCSIGACERRAGRSSPGE